MAGPGILRGQARLGWNWFFVLLQWALGGGLYPRRPGFVLDCADNRMANLEAPARLVVDPASSKCWTGTIISYSYHFLWYHANTLLKLSPFFESVSGWSEDSWSLKYFVWLNMLCYL